MKNVLALIAIIAFMFVGLSPPGQVDNIDQYDQTEFCQGIQDDATFEITGMISVLKYPTLETVSFIQNMVSMELQSNDGILNDQEIKPMTQSAHETHEYNLPGMFRIEIGESIASRGYRQTYI